MTSLETKYSFIIISNFIFQNSIKSLSGNSQIPKKAPYPFFLDRKNHIITLNILFSNYEYF